MYFWCKNPQLAAERADALDHNWGKRERKVADLALEQTFIFIDHYEMERCTTPVHFDETIQWGEIPFGDPEWVFALARHTFLKHLAHSWALTGEARYRDGWIALLEGWLADVPLTEETKTGPWRSLDSAIRIENWLRSIEIFAQGGEPLPAATLQRIKDSLKVHREFLVEEHSAFHRISNWGIIQDHGLFLASAYLGDRETATLALERLDEEFVLQTCPDGSHWEQSPLYQAEVLHCALDAILIARRQNISVPARLTRNAQLLCTGLAKLSRPDRVLFLQGDSDALDITDLLQSAAILFTDAELAWFSGREKTPSFFFNFPPEEWIVDAEQPKDHFYPFPHSGNYVMRSGFAPTSGCVRFHCGPYSSGHGHFDQLHVDLMVNRQPILTDGGRYTYVDSEERRALKSGFAHNTLLVDGKDMSEMVDSWAVNNVAEPLIGRHYTSEEIDYVEASHLGYHAQGVLLRRKVLRIRDDLLILCDECYGNDAHTYQALFHFDDEGTIEKAGEQIRFSSELAHASLYSIGAQSIKADRYPLSKHYNEMLEGDRVIYEQEAEGFARFITVIAYGPKQKVLNVNLEPVVKPLTDTVVDPQYATGLRIEVDGRTHTALFVHQEIDRGGYLLQCGTLEGWGRTLVQEHGKETIAITW